MKIVTVIQQVEVTSVMPTLPDISPQASFASISQAFLDESYLFPNRQYNRLVLSCEDGGTKKKYLIDLAEEIWQYLLHHGITITTACLPSSMKVEAD